MVLDTVRIECIHTFNPASIYRLVMRFVSAQALVNSIKNKVSASLEDAIEIGNFKFRDVDVVIIIGYSGVDDC